MNPDLIRQYVAESRIDALISLFDHLHSGKLRAERERDAFMRRMVDMAKTRGALPHDVSSEVRETIRTAKPALPVETVKQVHSSTKPKPKVATLDDLFKD